MPPNVIEGEWVAADIGGKDAVMIYKLLKAKPNFSEFKLAEKANKEVHTVRNILYKFYQQSLASFIRKKDQKQGWYIHYWAILEKNISHVYKKRLQLRIEELEEKLKKEQGEQDYACHNRCARLGFAQACEFSFRCPECGLLMEEVFDAALANTLEEEVAALKKRLND